MLSAANTNSPALSQSFAYDLGGKLTSNSSVGTYAYPAQGSSAFQPHAVSTAGAWSFGYDLNGNQTARLVAGVADRTIVYDNDNRPTSVTLGGATVTLQALADTATRARGFGGGKPVVLAAYQHVYDKAPAVEADRATALTMATLYSHGATQLLAGETDRLLCDPYYVRNHTIEPSTAALLKRWYDFLVVHDELLMPPGLTDVTNSYAGPYNGDLDIGFATAATSETATAGKVWRRVVAGDGRLIVHLINLTGQPDVLWDAPRAAPGNPGRGTLRCRPIRGRTPRVRAADPDGTGRLVDVAVRIEGDLAIADLPELAIWQLLVVDL